MFSSTCQPRKKRFCSILFQNQNLARRSLPQKCGWKHGNAGYSAGENLCLRKNNRALTLNTDRPSHGRPITLKTHAPQCAKSAGHSMYSVFAFFAASKSVWFPKRRPQTAQWGREQRSHHRLSRQKTSIGRFRPDT